MHGSLRILFINYCIKSAVVSVFFVKCQHITYGTLESRKSHPLHQRLFPRSNLKGQVNQSRCSIQILLLARKSTMSVAN